MARDGGKSLRDAAEGVVGLWVDEFALLKALSENCFPLVVPELLWGPGTGEGDGKRCPCNDFSSGVLVSPEGVKVSPWGKRGLV